VTTPRKVDARVSVPAFHERQHYACLLRKDIGDALRVRCRALNCSQGVFLELLLQKALLAEMVTPDDVYFYSSSARAARAVYDRLKHEGIWYGNKVSDARRSQLLKEFAAMALGERPGRYARKDVLPIEEQTRRQIENGRRSRGNRGGVGR